MEEYYINAKLQQMLRGPKWGETTRAYLRWVLDTYQDDGDAKIETEIKAVEGALPEATKLLHTKRLDWLSFFRRLQETNYGKLKLGRRQFPTRFIWHESPLEIARNFLVLPEDETLEHPEILSKTPHLQAAETSYSFPLRQDKIVQIRVPSDISAQELGRLADFIRLLPHF